MAPSGTLQGKAQRAMIRDTAAAANERNWQLFNELNFHLIENEIAKAINGLKTAKHVEQTL
jgi:hypothetical protein